MTKTKASRIPSCQFWNPCLGVVAPWSRRSSPLTFIQIETRDYRAFWWTSIYLVFNVSMLVEGCHFCQETCAIHWHFPHGIVRVANKERRRLEFLWIQWSRRVLWQPFWDFTWRFCRHDSHWIPPKPTSLLENGRGQRIPLQRRRSQKRITPWSFVYQTHQKTYGLEGVIFHATASTKGLAWDATPALSTTPSSYIWRGKTHVQIG